jgi:outer membrane biosynthesis protein TonB
MMKILSLLVVAGALAAAQTALHPSESQRFAATQRQQDRRHASLQLEHADVPMYPELAMAARIFGTVEVLVSVKDGRVISAQVQSGPPMLAAATVDNIQTWRFHSLVDTTFTAKFIYQLEEASLDVPSNPKIELQLPSLVKITAVPIPLDSK